MFLLFVLNTNLAKNLAQFSLENLNYLEKFSYHSFSSILEPQKTTTKKNYRKITVKIRSSTKLAYYSKVE